MKFTSLIIALATAISSYGQKITMDEIDEFNGNRKIATTRESIGAGLKNAIEVKAAVLIRPDTTKESTFDTLYVVYWRFKTYMISSVSDRDNITLKFVDGSTMILKNLSDFDITMADQHTNMYSIVDKADMFRISSSPVEKIRFSTSEGYFDKTVKESRRAIFQKMIKLILDFNGLAKK